MLRLVLVGSVAVLTILMAVACGGGDSPTSTVARDSSGSSEVAEYAVWCVGLEERMSQESDPTWGQSAEAHAEIIDAMEDMSAPEELKAFHDAGISFLKASHDFARMQDPSEPHDSGAANSEINARGKALLKVAETLDGETKSQLVDAGCRLASFF